MYWFLKKGRYIYLNRIKNFLTGLTYPRRPGLRIEKKERVGPMNEGGTQGGGEIPQPVENFRASVENFREMLTNQHISRPNWCSLLRPSFAV